MKLTRHIPAAVRPPCTYTLELTQDEFERFETLARANIGLSISRISEVNIKHDSDYLLTKFRAAHRDIVNEGTE